MRSKNAEQAALQRKLAECEEDLKQAHEALTFLSEKCAPLVEPYMYTDKQTSSISTFLSFIVIIYAGSRPEKGSNPWR